MRQICVGSDADRTFARVETVQFLQRAAPALQARRERAQGRPSPGEGHAHPGGALGVASQLHELQAREGVLEGFVLWGVVTPHERAGEVRIARNIVKK